ncbi:MAG: PEP-CTERM sorting domain-containing protein, partial [Phycisphaerae bacterium]|nr:PEP-CTERM sorting domain-containing protein [Phycisphaerae bacterium]
EIYYSGGWQLGDLVNSGTLYTSVAFNSKNTNKNNFTASLADGGVEQMYYSGGWQSDGVVLDDKVYVDLTYNVDASHNDFYYGAVVPEPATMSLLVLGGLGVLPRRKR